MNSVNAPLNKLKLPMKIKQEDYNIFKHEEQNHLSIGENYKHSPTAILTHIMLLPEVKVLAKKSWFLSGDYQAEFSYKENVFVLFSPWDSVDISPYDANTSDDIALELYQYIKTYSGITFTKCLSTKLKCLFLPFNYKP